MRRGERFVIIIIELFKESEWNECIVAVALNPYQACLLFLFLSKQMLAFGRTPFVLYDIQLFLFMFMLFSLYPLLLSLFPSFLYSWWPPTGFWKHEKLLSESVPMQYYCRCLDKVSVDAVHGVNCYFVGAKFINHVNYFKDF